MGAAGEEGRREESSSIDGKEVMTVPKYKVTKVFTVDAASKPEAVERVTNEPGELLEFVSVVLVAESAPQGGWKDSLVKQLTGKKKGR